MRLNVAVVHFGQQQVWVALSQLTLQQTNFGTAVWQARIEQQQSLLMSIVYVYAPCLASSWVAP